MCHVLDQGLQGRLLDLEMQEAKLRENERGGRHAALTACRTTTKRQHLTVGGKPAGVADMHKYVQTRAEKIKLKAAQAGCGGLSHNCLGDRL